MDLIGFLRLSQFVLQAEEDICDPYSNEVIHANVSNFSLKRCLRNFVLVFSIFVNFLIRIRLFLYVGWRF